MSLLYEAYGSQIKRWPPSGRHILAQYDEQSIIVYQAYSPAIGHFATRHGYFGGDGFSFTRMSWIKTNFLWMMYRSGWGTKEGQEVTLAVRLKRSAFATLLELAVHTQYIPAVYPDEEAWQEQLHRTSVRLQWDPDHDPVGTKLERRAIQLGLGGDILKHYAHEWIMEIDDISPFVQQQAEYVRTKIFAHLTTPYEAVYPLPHPELARKLLLSSLE